MAFVFAISGLMTAARITSSRSGFRKNFGSVSGGFREQKFQVRAFSGGASSGNTLAEHVVFFTIKEETPAEKQREFIKDLNRMGELEGVLQIMSNFALEPSAGYSIGVYTRFQDKSFIKPYLESPLHLGIIKDYIKPYTSRVVLLDYDATLSPPWIHQKFGAVRTTGFKFKPQVAAEDKIKVFEAFQSLQGAFIDGRVQQVTVGNNFSSPAYSQGFDAASVIRFESQEQLEAMKNDFNFQELLNSKINPFLESSISLDLVK